MSFHTYIDTHTHIHRRNRVIVCITDGGEGVSPNTEERRGVTKYRRLGRREAYQGTLDTHRHIKVHY